MKCIPRRKNSFVVFDSLYKEKYLLEQKRDKKYLKAS